MKYVKVLFISVDEVFVIQTRKKISKNNWITWTAEYFNKNKKVFFNLYYSRGVKLSSWRAGALQSLDITLIKHTWSS